MRYLRKSPFDCNVKELDQELLIRGAKMSGKKRIRFPNTPKGKEREEMMQQLKKLYEAAACKEPDEHLKYISTEDLVKVLKYKLGEIEIDGTRGVWGKDKREDYFEIEDPQVRNNAHCTAAVFMAEDMQCTSGGSVSLYIQDYGSTYDLCSKERFYGQTVAAGPMCTGILVANDIIATAAHFANPGNVRDLRFVFGYRLDNEKNSNVQMAPDGYKTWDLSGKKIYRGTHIVESRFKRGFNFKDWALVKLDETVTDGQVVTLANELPDIDQPVYTLGYPVGLPLKYAPGATVIDIRDTHFVADLDVYSGNSGSPVFDEETHELIGMVAHGDALDFRWTGKCWISAVYDKPDEDSEGSHCIHASAMEMLRQRFTG